jgi:hypothetical protein
MVLVRAPMRISIPLALCALVAAACDHGDEREPCGSGYLIQTFPIKGLSATEIFPKTSESIPLDANAALIDGSTVASAGVDVGSAPSLAGDVGRRDVGFENAFPYSKVNRIFVWVNQALPPEVSGAFSWTAYRSDDNLDWTAVPLEGTVQFGALDDRFEIGIAATQARYLKVVTAPLAVGVTTDARYEHISVTEVQALARVPSCAPAAVDGR